MASKELFFSQRQFAKITGISTVTLSKMVKSGNIKLQPDGKISSNEIRKLVIMQLMNYMRGTQADVCLVVSAWV